MRDSKQLYKELSYDFKTKNIIALLTVVKE